MEIYAVRCVGAFLLSRSRYGGVGRTRRGNARKHMDRKEILDEGRRKAFEDEVESLVRQKFSEVPAGAAEELGTLNCNLGIMKWSVKPNARETRCMKWVGAFFIGVAALFTLVKLAIEVKKGFWK